MTELDYVRANYCSNRDVATGNYDCPYATTVMNTICCTGHECNHKGIYEKPVVNNSVVCTSKECNNSSDYYKRYYLLGNIPKPTIPVDWDQNLADDEYPF